MEQDDDDCKQQEQALNEYLTDDENQEIDNNGKIGVLYAEGRSKRKKYCQTRKMNMQFKNERHRNIEMNNKVNCKTDIRKE